MNGYIGRFAPSPTGPLHAGSLVAALASWLDARAHGGLWLVRIEDVDSSRCLSGVAELILQQLAACGLHSDQTPVYQSQRSSVYQDALDGLVRRGLAYPCACTRKEIDVALQALGQVKSRHAELIYPGTCRRGLHGRPERAWRCRTDFLIRNQALAQTDQAPPAIFSIVKVVPGASASDQAAMQAAAPVSWADRRLGPQQQDVQTQVGDFILKRADGCFAYQLAVVVDDAAQGISDIVRGEDLADNTARQIWLQQALGLPTPRYLHTPLVLGANGEKLSKQNGASALNANEPLLALNQAARILGLTTQKATAQAALVTWVPEWAALHGKTAD